MNEWPVEVMKQYHDEDMAEPTISQINSYGIHNCDV